MQTLLVDAVTVSATAIRHVLTVSERPLSCADDIALFGIRAIAYRDAGPSACTTSDTGTVYLILSVIERLSLAGSSTTFVRGVALVRYRYDSSGAG